MVTQALLWCKKDDEKLQRTKMTEGLQNAFLGEGLKDFHQASFKQKKV